jgi:hypothetical protein
MSKTPSPTKTLRLNGIVLVSHTKLRNPRGTQNRKAFSRQSCNPHLRRLVAFMLPHVQVYVPCSEPTPSQDSLYFLIGEPQDTYNNVVVCRTSPMRTPSLKLFDPDSPTPLRGRRIELSSGKISLVFVYLKPNSTCLLDKQYRRSTSASSAEGNFSPRLRSQSPLPSSTVDNHSTLFCEVSEVCFLFPAFKKGKADT